MVHLPVMAVIIQYKQKSIDFKDITIIYVKKTAYRVYLKDISKNKAKKNN